LVSSTPLLVTVFSEMVRLKPSWEQSGPRPHRAPPAAPGRAGSAGDRVLRQMKARSSRFRA